MILLKKIYESQLVTDQKRFAQEAIWYIEHTDLGTYSPKNYSQIENSLSYTEKNFGIEGAIYIDKKPEEILVWD